MRLLIISGLALSPRGLASSPAAGARAAGGELRHHADASPPLRGSAATSSATTIDIERPTTRRGSTSTPPYLITAASTPICGENLTTVAERGKGLEEEDEQMGGENGVSEGKNPKENDKPCRLGNCCITSRLFVSYRSYDSRAAARSRRIAHAHSLGLGKK